MTKTDQWGSAETMAANRHQRFQVGRPIADVKRTFFDAVAAANSGDTQKVLDIVFGLDRPDRWAILMPLFQTLGASATVREVFVEVWSDVEWPSSFGRLIPTVREMAKHGPFVLTDPSDKKFFDALPEELTVWRGQTVGGKRSISWTTKRDKAVWFASRNALCLNKQPLVITGIVKKPDVWCAFNSRREFEVLCDPAKVKCKRDDAATAEAAAQLDATRGGECVQ